MILAYGHGENICTIIFFLCADEFRASASFLLEADVSGIRRFD
jgi:hypothetical protein